MYFNVFEIVFLQTTFLCCLMAAMMEEEKRIFSSTFRRTDRAQQTGKEFCVCSNHSATSCLLFCLPLHIDEARERSIYFHSQIIDILEILFRFIHHVAAAAAILRLFDEMPKWISIIFSLSVRRFLFHLFMPSNSTFMSLTFPKCLL